MAPCQRPLSTTLNCHRLRNTGYALFSMNSLRTAFQRTIYSKTRALTMQPAISTITSESPFLDQLMRMPKTQNRRYMLGSGKKSKTMVPMATPSQQVKRCKMHGDWAESFSPCQDQCSGFRWTSMAELAYGDPTTHNLLATCFRLSQSFGEGYFRPNARKGAVRNEAFMRSYPTFSNLF